MSETCRRGRRVLTFAVQRGSSLTSRRGAHTSVQPGARRCHGARQVGDSKRFKQLAGLCALDFTAARFVLAATSSCDCTDYTDGLTICGSQPVALMLLALCVT